jgi:hypothetical protein
MKSLYLKLGIAVTLGTASLIAPLALSGQDVAHAVTGIVRHVDHGAKEVAVETKDGAVHTIKYSDKTIVKTDKVSKKGGADVWLGTRDGAKVTVRYTEKAGDKTAVAIKDASEKTGSALK